MLNLKLTYFSIDFFFSPLTNAPFYRLFLMENFMASISHTDDPICYLCISNSWYSISSVQLSIVNNSLLRKFSIAAFVYATTMTFSTRPASLLLWSHLFLRCNCISAITVVTCLYKLALNSLLPALAAVSWALWVAILFSESLSDCLIALYLLTEMLLSWYFWSQIWVSDNPFCE